MSHSTAKPKCPGCLQFVTKNSDGQSIVCQLCSKKKRKVFRFCWDCQREWPSNSSSYSSCTLPNCALRAALLADQRISDSKSSAKRCPYFRACPKCNALLTHNGQGCPIIECPECNTGFCFRCLRPDCFGRTWYSENLFEVRHHLYGHHLNENEQCTIVDNSQSLKALQL